MTASIRLALHLRALAAPGVLVLGLALLLAQAERLLAEAPPPVAAVGGVAAGGYDVVAYFTQGEPVPGDPAHALKWRGAVWLFASAESQLAFEMNPRAYAPRFGGYCAFALSQGRLALADPAAFAIHEGRLYLAHSPAVLDRWRADPARFIDAARAEWPAVLGR